MLVAISIVLLVFTGETLSNRCRRCCDPEISCGPNSHPVECASSCPLTCAEPDPVPCIASCNQNPCVCDEGYIFAKKDGPCINVTECTNTSYGPFCRPHSHPVECATSCPLTCDNPEPVPCIESCNQNPCVCDDGYIFAKKDGPCIKETECISTPPKCGVNQSYVNCKIDCPTQNCPVDDRRIFVLCTIPSPCPGGCACDPSYLYLNSEDKTCIKSTDCPPIECTRPNEVYDPQPTRCYLESCQERNTPCDFPDSTPRCVCKKGYYRNSEDICVPEWECPPVCTVPDECKRTCANPNPPNCPYSPPSSNLDGCDCQEGFILSDYGGECIRIQDCPSGCNGDSHATARQCPPPCPSTCSSPDQTPCKKRCEPIGCACDPGYIYDDSCGMCVVPGDCPGGNPCGPNGTFVPCNINCPRDFCSVDDRRGVIICDPPRDCPSGCACRFNHKRRSNEDHTCIEATDCPPINCTRPNEEYCSCPSACLAEMCEDRNNPPAACNTLVQDCQPACICKQGTYRNASDTCVEPCQCE